MKVSRLWIQPYYDNKAQSETTIQASGSTYWFHFKYYAEVVMEHQNSCKVEPTYVFNEQLENSNICETEIDGQRTRNNYYLENSDVDELMKVKTVLTESQDDILFEDSTDIPLRKSKETFDNCIKTDVIKGRNENKCISAIEMETSNDLLDNSIKAEVTKDKNSNKSVIAIEKKSIDDLKNKIFTIENYVDCPYENCTMKIYIDHIEKHLHDHELNTSNLDKKYFKQCYLCVECGRKYKGFNSISVHIFNHINSVSHEISKSKLYSQEKDKNSFQILSESESEIDFNPDSSDDRYRPNSSLKNRRHKPSVIKTKKLKNQSVQCHRCDKICKDGKHYDIHMKNAHNEMLCKLCQGLFRGIIALNAHITTVHKKNLTCRFCGENFENEMDKTSHMKLLHKEKKRVIKYSICDVCGKSMQYHSLQLHMQIHSSAEVYNCDQCDFHGNTKFNLSRHWTRVHSNLKSIKCEICEKDFKNINTHRRHMRDYHSSTSADKPFICDVCGKAFKHAKHLKRHQMLHSGEKPFGCTFCNYKTNQRSNVTIHMKSHLKQISAEKEQL